MKLSGLVTTIESGYLYLNKNIPNLQVGMHVRVKVSIKEGDKKRIQAYRGQIIRYHRAFLNSTITVRRVSKSGAMERIFPLHSRDISSIEIESEFSTI